MVLTQEQVSLRKRLAKNLHSGFDKGLENAPVLSDFLGALAIEENSTDERTQRALLELLLDQAAGRWLDLWGYVFNVYPRKPYEVDASYRARIIKETTRPRMNEFSIEDVLNGEDSSAYAVVFTPLTKVVFASQQGRASSGWHCADGRYWHGCVIDVLTDKYTPTLEYLVSRNHAAGILAWITTRIRQRMDLSLRISSADNISTLSASTLTIRGNYRTEDITNSREVVGKGFLVPNVKIVEETV
jgi:hypothetical protein